MKKLPNIEITELFLVKSNWKNTFVGQIKREKTEDNEPIIYGNVVIKEGKIWSSAGSEEEIGNKLDEMCALKLNHGLNDLSGTNVEIANQLFNLN